MTSPSEDASPRPDLALRRQSALDRIAADAAKANGVLERARETTEAAQIGARGIGAIDAKGIGAISGSIEKLRNLAKAAANAPSLQAKAFNLDGMDSRTSMSEMLAELDADAEAVGEALAKERRETVAREERMVTALEASQQALTGVLETLRAQDERASLEGQWQRAIYALGVLALISGLCIGNLLATAWWAALAGGGAAAALSVGILWWAGLLQRAARE